jgi:hypothetical protein
MTTATKGDWKKKAPTGTFDKLISKQTSYLKRTDKFTLEKIDTDSNGWYSVQKHSIKLYLLDSVTLRNSAVSR